VSKAPFSTELTVATHGKGAVDVTDEIRRLAAASGVRTGTCTIFVKHTSASLVIQENADPSVRRDLARWLEHIAPERPAFGPWEHDDEGPDDMPAHAKASVLKTSEVVPIVGGRLALGTWQGIYLWEHRTRPHQRTLVVVILGE
jgi:secondary thiamine-phosphate synthase enzyme